MMTLGMVGNGCEDTEMSPSSCATEQKESDGVFVQCNGCEAGVSVVVRWSRASRADTRRATIARAWPLHVMPKPLPHALTPMSYTIVVGRVWLGVGWSS